VEAVAWVTIILLVLLGMRRLALIVATIGRHPVLNPTKAQQPLVAVLVAARNEEARLPALLLGLQKVAYPPEKLRLLLADDASRDQTAQLFYDFSAGRPNATVIRIESQVGKASALNRLMALEPKAELIAVFDADHIPEPDCLGLLVAALADPAVGCASGYLEPRNPEASLTARYCALEAWVTQLVNHGGKDRLFRSAPTLGGNCIYRRTALDEAGGFPPGAFSEDTEVSLAIVKAGWKTRFQRSARASNAVLETLPEFWRQRIRWNRGLYSSAGHASNVESWVTALGYGDRLVLLLGVLPVVWGTLSPWWLVAYLATPLTALFCALWCARRLRDAPMFILAAMVMFPVDLAVTVWSTGIALLGRKVHWR
jgi:cellulose synthase/poly-beta-1,6-N-acetylglucosamine synthase-like glycosyltransferase